jgi:photosystem I reaction center subunit XII
MVTESQILIALSIALVAGLLALRLGSTLYL